MLNRFNIAIVFVSLYSSTLFGISDDGWAYCNLDGPGLATQRLVWACPTPENPRKLCGPRKPNADWICRLSGAGTPAAGTDRIANRRRCVSAEKRECALDAGGIPGPGDHNVPACAAYHIAAGPNLPDASCFCIPPLTAYGKYCDEFGQLVGGRG